MMIWNPWHGCHKSVPAVQTATFTDGTKVSEKIISDYILLSQTKMQEKQKKNYWKEKRNSPGDLVWNLLF